MEKITVSDLIPRGSRNDASRRVKGAWPRRRVHVAIAIWDKPWKSGPKAEVTGWFIVAVARRGKRLVREGSTPKKDWAPEALRDLLATTRNLARNKGEVWVVTGSRQVALRGLIDAEGLTVSGSFSEENRAAAQASALLRKKRRQLSRPNRKEKARKQAAARAAAPETHWLPNYSRTNGNGGDLVISCDASSDTHSTGSICFVASNGDFLLRTRQTGISTNELELEAISQALKYAVRVEANSVLVESDSEGALAAVNRVQRHGARGRRWQGFSAGSLSRFQQAYHDATKMMDVKIERVMGHTGDPLNEAADKIAYLALRASVHERHASEAAVKQGIDEALTRAQRRQG